MCGGYFWFVSRRIDRAPRTVPMPRSATAPGDRLLQPGSYWPFGLALAALAAGLGLVYWQLWLIGAGMLAVLAATGGLLFEYYSAPATAAE